MTNVWGFFLQTLSVSAVALVLLIIKRLFLDKISPNVQYALWLVLALRIVLPVGAGVSILFPVPVWVELLKAKVERHLTSAYSNMYELTGNRHIFPVYREMPVSVTDWLFVIYGIGIAVVLLHYAVAYIRLRRVLRHNGVTDEAMQAKVDSVAEAFGLRTVPVRVVSGVYSPFVCGIFRPVLVLPEDRELSDSVLLHELLHLEHHDPAKNMIWCILRALHWCNPFLWYVVNRIENDLETCCDQRVLERLEGEARRDYGKTLLLMANDRYARMPGTSSISNGGKNIARRIEAIVRFKTYPKGVTFALVCMAVLLVNAAVSGQMVNGSDACLRPVEESRLDYALAMSRVHRCTTLAGALDTYAKGIIYQNGIYLAMASPLSQQQVLEAAMRESAAESWVAYHVGRGFDDEDQMAVSEAAGYRICNLKECEDGGYEASLLFSGVCPSEEQMENGTQTLALPVLAHETDDGWVVERTGEADCIDTAFDAGYMDLSLLPPLQRYEGTCEYGRVTLNVYNFYIIEGNNIIGEKNMIGDELIPNAEFHDASILQQGVYDIRQADAGMPEYHVSITYARVLEGEDTPVYPHTPVLGSDSGSSSDGHAWENRPVSKLEKDGVIKMGSGEGWDIEQVGCVPEGYGVRIYWDGKLKKELRLEEVYGQ